MKEKRRRKSTDLVEVCDKCFKASCWHGVFYCDRYRGAGIVNKTVKELHEINAEHESYFAFEPPLTPY